MDRQGKAATSTRRVKSTEKKGFGERVRIFMTRIIFLITPSTLYPLMAFALLVDLDGDMA